MAISAYSAGLGHIGIPTDNVQETKDFYRKLGFAPVHDGVNPAGNQQVAFLQLGNILIETYEEKPARAPGAINHLAIACTDIQAAYREAKALGLKILSNGIESLPFWDNGVSFFIIEGRNAERIEYCQRF